MSEAKEFMQYVEKGWGSELWIVNRPQYCGKILTLTYGKACALHWHEKKDETFYNDTSSPVYVHWASHGTLIAGQTLWLNSVQLNGGDYFYVPPGLIHMIQAVRGYTCTILEFSTHHEDGDSFFIHPGDETDLGVAELPHRWMREVPIAYRQLKEDYFRFDGPR